MRNISPNPAPPDHRTSGSMIFVVTVTATLAGLLCGETLSNYAVYRDQALRSKAFGENHRLRSSAVD